MLRPIAILFVVLLMFSGMSHAGGIPAPLDLRKDGQQAACRGVPVIILFSLPDCPFCATVRQNYLMSLMRDLPPRERPVIREISVTGTGAFIGFGNEKISQRQFAYDHGVRFAPTVMLFDGAGRSLTAPIIGGDTAGLYGGYLDNALAEAARKISDAPIVCPRRAAAT